MSPPISLIDGKILAKIGFASVFDPTCRRQLIVFPYQLPANSLSD
jgi:hypothetical protein